MKIELLATYPIAYNETGITLQDRFPALVGGVFTMLLTAENDSYTAVVKFNYGEMWMFLSLYDRSGNLLQGETYVADAPFNLLTCNALFGYALVFVKALKRFEFYKLNDTKWYNSVELTEDEVYQVLLTQSFEALDE